MFLFKWIRSFQHPQDQVSVLLNGVCFIRLQVAFVFPTLPPFVFLQGLRFLNRVSILLMGSFSILFRQCSYSVILMKILMELQVRHSSFFSSPVDLIQALVLSILLFFFSNAFLMPVHLLIIHLSLLNCSGMLKISRRFVFPLCIRSSSFEIGISFKSFNSTGATSLLNLFNAVSFEWALTHRSIPRILPDSSIFPELS